MTHDQVRFYLSDGVERDSHDYQQRSAAEIERSVQRVPEVVWQYRDRGYEQSAADYTQRSPNSVRWWSAVGNLVRIYASLGDSTRTHLWQAHFSEPRFNPIRPWMPASLMESLQKSGRIHP